MRWVSSAVCGVLSVDQEVALSQHDASWCMCVSAINLSASTDLFKVTFFSVPNVSSYQVNSFSVTSFSFDAF